MRRPSLFCGKMKYTTGIKILFLYSSPYVFDTYAMAFLSSKFASQIKLYNLWWDSISSHRVPFSGSRVTGSHVPRSQLPRSKVSGSRLPESRVSGPDFGLCVESHLVRGKFMWKRLCGTSSHYLLFAGTLYSYLLYRGFLTFSTKFWSTNLRFPLASGRVSANEQTTVLKWSCETFELAFT